MPPVEVVTPDTEVVAPELVVPKFAAPELAAETLTREQLAPPKIGPKKSTPVSIVACIPFIGAHLLALAGALYVGVRWQLVVLAVALQFLRMFFITAGYHRYFSHRSYKTSRLFQFFLAFGGTLAAQKGVLWWAAHHRDHHRYSDTEKDLHSPVQRGFWWSHVGWILSGLYDETAYEKIRDFAKYPELVWLNKLWMVPPLLGVAGLYALGGLEYVVWGGLVSTVLLWHSTFTINSLSHVIGSRRYPTADDSRNNVVLALLTMGEGWHNNHHHYQSSANQGFFWYEVDLSYYVLRALSLVRIVWDVRTPPGWVLRNESAPSAPAQAAAA